MLNLFRKELIRRWRSPVATLTMIVFPFLMSGMVGAVAGGGGSSGRFPVIDVLVWDQDDAFLTNLVLGPLQSDEAAQYLRITEVGEAGMTLIAEDEASALVIFPENFSADLMEGRTTHIQVIRNPAEGIKPEVVEQGVEALATYLDQAAKVLGPELAEMSALLDLDDYPGSERLIALARELIQRLDTASRFIFPPLLQIENVKETKDDGTTVDVNVFGYVLVMVSVMSVLFVASRSILDLYEEEKTGMLRRQLATPLTVSRLVGAKILFGVLFGILVMIILLIAGAVLRWYTWPVDLPGVLVLTAVYSLAACGLMSVVYALCRTERQAGALTWLVIMGMSALGGSMAPLSSFPESVQRIARFTLNFWAVDGYTDLLFLKDPLTSVLRHVGILLAFGAIAATVGRHLLVQRYKRALP